MCNLRQTYKQKTEEKMKYKILLLMFLIIAFLAMVSATPQVILTEINLSIYAQNNTITWKIIGEGISATDSFSISTNYSRDKIPITFSRDIDQNNTDVAVLIRALAQNNNVSNNWENCVISLADTQKNLSICEEDIGYKSNYTDCQTSLSSSRNSEKDSQDKITSLTDEVKGLKNMRLILGAAAIILGLVAWTFYRRANVKTINSPMKQLPSSARI